MRVYDNGWRHVSFQTAPGLIWTGAKSLEDLKPTQEIMDALGPYPKILDFGCGMGRNTFELARLGHDVTVFDFPNMIQMLMADPRYTTKIAVETDWLRLVSSRFDAILATLVIQHLPADVADEYLAAMAKMTGNLLVHSRAYLDYAGGEVIEAILKHFALDEDRNTKQQIEQALHCRGEEHFIAWFVPRLENYECENV